LDQLSQDLNVARGESHHTSRCRSLGSGFAAQRARALDKQSSRRKIERPDAECDSLRGPQARIEKCKQECVIRVICPFPVGAEMSTQAPAFSKNEFKQLVALVFGKRFGPWHDAAWPFEIAKRESHVEAGLPRIA